MSKILIDEAVVRQALEALEDLGMKHYENTGDVLYKEAFNALHQALANEALDKMAENARELGLSYEQPAQKPDPDELTIAYMSGLHDGKKRKPWVGLTDEEIDDIEATWEATQEWVSFSHATRVIEAKLMEKNQ
jgi:hypothetical protein